MSDPQEASSNPANEHENLRVAYQAVCNRHRQIDDFRGKLLALLPIASGAAGLALLSQSDVKYQYLTAIGLYGCAITMGLFLYELQGVSECRRVMEQAGGLEAKLNVPEGLGQFRDQPPPRLRELVGAEMASWVVYVSVFAGWFYLAGVGGSWWEDTSPMYVAGVAVALLLLRWLTIEPREQRRRQGERNARVQ